MKHPSDPKLQEAQAAADSGKKTEALRANPMPIFALGQDHARILVAEDNITNQQVAMCTLEKLGLRADLVVNGAEAIEALETIPYNLVLMDVQMPGMDGFEATLRIRDPHSRVLNHQVPIIAMTAHALPGDREKCLAAGMDDYVIKPVGLAALGEALGKWLPSNGEGRQRLAVETNPASSTTPVFDRAALLDRVLYDEELAGEVIEGFLGDLPGQILLLKNSAAAGDARHVEQQAHKIRGASATVGGVALSALAATLEQAARTGDLVVISTRLAELDEQFEALKAAMNPETSD